MFYGTQSGVYTFTQAAGNVTSWTVGNLTAGQTYYFAVQAVNTAGMTSPLSQEVSTSVPIGSTACTGVTATAPATGAAGSPVAFTAQPSPAGCTGAVTYQWAFGDGTSSALGTVSHAYSAARSYTWTLSATANGAAVAAQTGTIAVSNLQPACTGVTATAPATGAVGSPVAFTAQPSPAGCTGAVTYQWALGDGTSSALGTVSHAYSAAAELHVDPVGDGKRHGGGGTDGHDCDVRRRLARCGRWSPRRRRGRGWIRWRRCGRTWG